MTKLIRQYASRLRINTYSTSWVETAQQAWCKSNIIGCKTLQLGAFLSPSKQNWPWIPWAVEHLFWKDHDKQKCPCLGWRRLQLWWYRVEHNASTPRGTKTRHSAATFGHYNEHCLTEAVNISTREDKILDILLTNCPGPVRKVKGIPPIGKADHDFLYVELRPNA